MEVSIDEAVRGLAAVWVAIALLGSGMSVWFLRHCRG